MLHPNTAVKNRDAPGIPTQAGAVPCLDTLSYAPSPPPHQFPCHRPMSASWSPPFSAPLASQPHFSRLPVQPLCSSSLCTMFVPPVPPREQWHAFSSYIISRNICASLLRLKINRSLTISDHFSLIGKTINKQKQFLRMGKVGQPHNKMLTETLTLGSAALEWRTFFGHLVPLIIIGARYFWISSSSNYNWSWTFRGISGLSIQLHKTHRLCRMPQAGMWCHSSIPCHSLPLSSLQPGSQF